MDGNAPQVAEQECYCLGCRYPLVGLSVNRCPECGRGFDPNDSATFHADLVQAGVEKWLRVAGIGRNLAVVCLVGLWALPAWMPELPALVAAGLPTAGLAMAMLLFLPGLLMAGLRYRGLGYALNIILVSIALMPLFALGLLLGPLLIHRDWQLDRRQIRRARVDDPLR